MGRVFGRGLCWELMNEHPLKLRKFPKLKAVGSCGSVAEKISYICLAFPLPLTFACGLWWKQDVGLNGFFIWGSTPLPLYSWRITLKHLEPHDSSKPSKSNQELLREQLLGIYFYFASWYTFLCHQNLSSNRHTAALQLHTSNQTILLSFLSRKYLFREKET